MHGTTRRLRATSRLASVQLLLLLLLLLDAKLSVLAVTVPREWELICQI
jgi:hypothetical protein